MEDILVRCVVLANRDKKSHGGSRPAFSSSRVRISQTRRLGPEAALELRRVHDGETQETEIEVDDDEAALKRFHRAVGVIDVLSVCPTSECAKKPGAKDLIRAVISIAPQFYETFEDFDADIGSENELWRILADKIWFHHGEEEEGVDSIEPPGLTEARAA